MVRQLTSEEYEAFVRQKRAAAIHFDAEWDVGYRPITRCKMREAMDALATQANFGEVDCDRHADLARSIRILNVPAVAYYSHGSLAAVLIGVRQNVRERVERLLRGQPIGYEDGLNSDDRPITTRAIPKWFGAKNVVKKYWLGALIVVLMLFMFAYIKSQG